MTTLPGLVPPGYQDPAPWRAARCVSASRGSNRQPGAQRDPARCQQQQLLADVQNSGDTAGRIQRVVEGAAGFAQCETEVSEEANLYPSYAGTKDLWCKAQGYTTAKRKGKAS